MTDDTANDRKQKLRATATELERTIGELTSQLLFADELDRLSRRQAKLDDTAASLAGLRARGYRYGGDLEALLAAAGEAAPTVLAAARQESDAAGRRLRPRLDEAARTVRALAAQAELTGQEHRLESPEREVEALEDAVREARKRIDAVARPLCEPFDDLERRLRRLQRMMDQFDEGSFAMEPAENPVAAYEATWQDDPAGARPEGLLLLSDHRLRFEQREERVTKRKFLIFAAEKESIKRCLIDEPIGHLQASDDETRGWVLKDQLLVLTWRAAASAPRTTTLELDGTSAEKADALVESILSGDLARDRWSGSDTASGEVRLQWPSECDDCGARLVPPVKGQTRIKCGYCGRSYEVTRTAAGPGDGG